MAKKFNEHEKKTIEDALIEQGKTLFATFGFQKTSISDITKKVGIAQGTFYTFFQSKEMLYFHILELEEAKIKEQLMNVELFKKYQPKQALKLILKEMIKTVETNPFIRELYVGSTMEAILKRLPADVLEEHFHHDTDSMLPFIEKLQEAGIALKKEPEMIGSLLRSLFVLTLHEKEIGTAMYHDTIDLFIDLIVDGIVE